MTTLSLEGKFFEKPRGGQIDPPSSPPPAVLGPKENIFLVKVCTIYIFVWIFCLTWSFADPMTYYKN